MVATTLFGRSEESARVDALLDAVAGGPAALVLIGEAGIGKSAVWRVAVDRARTHARPRATVGPDALTVLTARAVEVEHDLPGVALADLLGPVAATVLPMLPAPQADGLAVALLLERPTTPVDPHVIGAATLGAIERLSADRPVVIAIDDVQWLDAATAAALDFALRRAWDRGLRIGILATARRTPERDPLPHWLERLVPPTAIVEVAPVNLGVLHNIIRERTGLALTRPRLIRVEEASLGNPLRAIELARALAAGGRWPLPGEPLPIPVDIERLVAARLDRLASDDRRALAVVAISADPTTAGVADALGWSAEATRASLQRAVGEDLLESPEGADGPWRCAHPLFRSAAIAAVSVSDRRAMHARLADRTADAEACARHTALAGVDRDAVAADRIERGAMAAWRRGAAAVAGEWAVVAADRTPLDDPAAGARRRVLAARWLGSAGDVERARALLTDAIPTMPPGDARAEAMEAAAQMAGWVEGSAALVATATAALADARDPHVRARILLRIANEADAIGGTAALPYIDEALAVLEAVDAAEHEPDLLACALLQSALLRFHLGLGDDAAAVSRARALLSEAPRRALDGVDRPESLRAHELTWVLAADHDQFSDAIPILLEESERARTRGHDRPMAILESEVTLLYLWAGDLESADDHARGALEAAELADHPQSRAAALSAIAAVALATGRLDDAYGAARESLALFGDDGFLADRNRATLGRVALVRGDAATACTGLGALLDAQLARDGRESLGDRYTPDLAEAAAAAGDLQRVDAVADLLAGVARSTPRPWTRVMAPRTRALARAARGDLDGADEAIREAMAAAVGLEMPLERARTSLVAGRIARRRKERARAGACFDDAAAGFAAMGAAAWLRIARAEAARLGRRSGAGAPDALTDTETQVARLAAQGRTNRQVGEALFLTPKSVEGVLSRVYGKLGIRSRAELGAWLASMDRDSPVSSDA